MTFRLGAEIHGLIKNTQFAPKGAQSFPLFYLFDFKLAFYCACFEAMTIQLISQRREYIYMFGLVILVRFWKTLFFVQKKKTQRSDE